MYIYFVREESEVVVGLGKRRHLGLGVVVTSSTALAGKNRT